MEVVLKPELFLALPEELLCSNCLLVLQEPHLMSCCGGHICEKCIDKFIKAQRYSPCCQEKFGSYTSLLDKGVKKKIERLEVRCVNNGKNCDWNGKCDQLVHHLEHDCPAQLQACPIKCGGMFPRYLLKQHMEGQCGIPSSSNIEESSKQSNETTSETMAPKMEKNYKVEINEMREELEKIKTDLQQRFETLMESNEQPSLLDQLEKKLMKTITELQAETRATLDANKAEFEERLRKIEDYSKKENETEIQSSQLAIATKTDPEIKWIDSQWCIPIAPTPTLLPLPPCIVTMTGYEGLKRSRQEWFSPTIFSHPAGYRFVLGIQACGSEIGKNTYVSLAVYLAKGEHDDQLKWPFQGNVSVSLLNWREKKGNKDTKVMFDGRANTKGLCNRVIKGEGVEQRASKGNGYPQFLPYGSLGYNKANNTQYLHKDTLCFCITKIETC